MPHNPAGLPMTQPDNRPVDPDNDEMLIARRFRSNDPEYLLHIWAGTQTWYVAYREGYDGLMPVSPMYHTITRDAVQEALDTLLPDPVCGMRYDPVRLQALGFSLPPRRGE